MKRLIGIILSLIIVISCTTPISVHAIEDQLIINTVDVQYRWSNWNRSNSIGSIDVYEIVNITDQFNIKYEIICADYYDLTDNIKNFRLDVDNYGPSTEPDIFEIVFPNVSNIRWSDCVSDFSCTNYVKDDYRTSIYVGGYPFSMYYTDKNGNRANGMLRCDDIYKLKADIFNNRGRLVINSGDVLFQASFKIDVNGFPNITNNQILRYLSQYENLNVFVDGSGSIQNAFGDINGDNLVDAADAQMILNYYVYTLVNDNAESLEEWISKQ